MKIIVGATRQFHALSRRQVEAFFGVLPPKCGENIEEFILSNFERGHESFEYIDTERRVEFYMLVKEKTTETTEQALRQFLLGVARMEAGSKFWRPLDRSERRDYDTFIEMWMPPCRLAAGIGE